MLRNSSKTSHFIAVCKWLHEILVASNAFSTPHAFNIRLCARLRVSYLNYAIKATEDSRQIITLKIINSTKASSGIANEK